MGARVFRFKPPGGHVYCLGPYASAVMHSIPKLQLTFGVDLPNRQNKSDPKRKSPLQRTILMTTGIPPHGLFVGEHPLVHTIKPWRESPSAF